jgi:hypothetical protein
MITVKSDERTALILSSFFQLIVLWVFVFGICEIGVLTLAHQTNMGMLHHRGMVTQHVLRARRLVYNMIQPVTVGVGLRNRTSSSSSGLHSSSRDRAFPNTPNVHHTAPVGTVKNTASTSSIISLECLQQGIETFNDVAQTLEVMDDMWPARFVGFKVDREHLASAVSAMGLFLVAVIDFCTFGSISVMDS